MPHRKKGSSDMPGLDQKDGGGNGNGSDGAWVDLGAPLAMEAPELDLSQLDFLQLSHFIEQYPFGHAEVQDKKPIPQQQQPPHSAVAGESSGAPILPFQSTGIDEGYDGKDEDAAVTHRRAQKKKRQRVESALSRKEEAEEGADEVYPTPLASKLARHELSLCPYEGVDLSAVAALECEPVHCFAMEPMGPDPRDYFGTPIERGQLQARLIEPVSGTSKPRRRDLLGASSNLARPPGRSIHLIFLQFPILATPDSLDHGFALLLICRRKELGAKWTPLCLASFEAPSSRKKLVGSQASFVANLERGTNVYTGKRVWGERTSHVPRGKDPAKAVRIEPKGSSKNFEDDTSYCVMVSLHRSDGQLLRDVQGRACIAQTNPFCFQERQPDITLQHLLAELEKLSVSERVALAIKASSNDSSMLLLRNSPETQASAGLMSPAMFAQLPSTACLLSHFFPTADSPFTAAYKDRLRSTARLLGELHARPELMERHPRYLKSVNFSGTKGRYYQLVDSNLAEHQRWLLSQGIGLDIDDVHDRAERLTTVVANPRYKSHWVVCVSNVYPDAIVVDREDPEQVYCLAEEGRESPLDLMDRLYPLARLAFTSKLPEADFQDVFFAPYTAAYEDNCDGNERAIFQERFWLHLHGIHLDYFLYWTKFRNPSACRRIQARLLQEESHFASSFFSHDCFRKFELHAIPQ